MQIKIRLPFLFLSVLLVKLTIASPHTSDLEHPGLHDSADSFVISDSDQLVYDPVELSEVLKAITGKKEAVSFSLGRSLKNKNIEAKYFPGKSNKNALIIGGVHGSELSSIAIAKELVNLLSDGREIYYNVIIIPCLFPDNAAAASARLEKKPEMTNFGRYTSELNADPNRQMPSPGQFFSPTMPCDHLGRTIENENQLLLQLIQEFKPGRIASIHAIRDTAHAGVYADPRTDAAGIALGFDSDSSLAVDMASFIKQGGGNVQGNYWQGIPTALYYKDPEPAPAGQLQQRNFNGSSLPGNRGSGTSLGTWATTAIDDTEDPGLGRPAIRLFTIEFPGYWAPAHYKSVAQQLYFRNQVSLYSSSLADIFLQNNYVEE